MSELEFESCTEHAEKQDKNWFLSLTKKWAKLLTCQTKFEYFHKNKYVQLNKYQADLYLLQLSHQMTDVCLLISYFLSAFDCSGMLGT